MLLPCQVSGSNGVVSQKAVIFSISLFYLATFFDTDEIKADVWTSVTVSTMPVVFMACNFTKTIV
jgi:hypothetical protein